ncbi:class A beta-lactamase-related serine hydrolase [Novosphingobium sp. 9]|uniref:class A beta-lactamase-related serine hydrolase n=1 Tax=Novosphingobium sp. 9 TaxID=2025349 RepID=UPI0021B6AEA0|nr:class A beta-lactamase-related serine hydrolase [Novosphingobium sp. 9]
MAHGRFRKFASLWLTTLAAMVALAVSAPAYAQSVDEALLRQRSDDVLAVLEGRKPAAEVFDATFLAAVSPDQLKALAAQLSERAGPLESYDQFKVEGPYAASAMLHFARGSAPAHLVVGGGPEHLVAGYRIFALTLNDDSFARLDADFAALPGKSGYGVFALDTATDSAPKLIHGQDARHPFAIGSTFKLYVLAALARQVKEGQRSWSDVVPVSGKSFPGGTLHGFPDGAPVTLHTLASLMISISDNSATDMLVRLVGQDALAREVTLAHHAHPDALRPFLTTAQFFALKRAGPDATARYAKGSPAERAAQLSALDMRGVAEADPGAVFGRGPVAIDEVEWFASPTDLARVMEDLRDLDSPEASAILTINPALDAPTRQKWAYVGYKGGSEDGVISMTWLLRAPSGEWRIVTGSWNDKKASVDEGRFQSLMLRAVKLAG